MKLKIRKEEILEGTQKSASITPSKTGAAYLRSTWLRARGDQLEIMATDANMEFTGKYEASVENEGLVGVNARKLAELIRRMPPGEIHLRLNENGNILYLEQGRKRFKLPTNDATWFQELSAFPEDYFLWSGEELKKILNKTTFCIADNESLSGINCLFMTSQEDNQIEVCGLDTSKIAMYWFTDEKIHEILQRDNILLEKPYLNELRRWISSKEIYIGISSKKIFFSQDGGREIFSMPLRSGEFPGYQNILKTYKNQLNSSIKFYREEMLDCLERISLFTTGDFQSTHFKIFDDYIHLDYQGQESGEAYEEIECEAEGEVNEIILSTGQLIEILNHFESERIQFSLCYSTAPCFISGEEDTGYTCITMPIMVEEETYYTEEEI